MYNEFMTIVSQSGVVEQTLNEDRGCREIELLVANIGDTPTNENILNVCGGYFGSGSRFYLRRIKTDGVYRIRFPEIGASLPCKITYGKVGDLSIIVYARIIEYGGQPDPNYFLITGVDEDGKPIYAEEEP